jgi:hypothetical protein
LYGTSEQFDNNRESVAIEFPESPETVQSTLARVLELQNAPTDAQLVRMASVSITHVEHDSWQGGTDFYQLDLRIPLEVFVQLQQAIEEHEKRLQAVAAGIWRDLDSHVITSTRIAPDRAGGVGGVIAAPTRGVMPAYWTPGSFRLFISHHHSQRAVVGQLRTEVSWLGITAFVAHDDIEPNQVWQAEIEKALQSCEALTAVVSPDFVESKWCDQEVGIALGRNIEVLPIAWGAPPHGFIGKIQAVPVAGGQPLASAAHTIVSVLLKSPRTSVSMTNALVGALASAPSYAMAKSTAGLLEQAPALAAAHATQLRRARAENGQVRDAFGVPDRIERILKSHGL